MRFSDYFDLAASQAELDFGDIPLNTDIRLFVDPYALSIEPERWFAECNELVVSYFELLVESIRRNDRAAGAQLLSHLHEPNDTHFGFSRRRPAGRGIGRGQAAQLYRRLAQSRAARTGYLRDLSDCELVIRGIGPDKISDITTNIIRAKLVEYTGTQCCLLGIPTRRAASGVCWDPATRRWSSRYAMLPIYEGRPILLVPKGAARYRMAVDHVDYYRDFVLEFLKAEYLDAGRALVTVLKSGSRVVYKKDVRQRHPLSKDFLFRFSMQHPEVLEQYKGSLPTKVADIEDKDIEARQEEVRPVDVMPLVRELEGIPTGGAAAHTYHRFIKRALVGIFSPRVYKPTVEHEVHEGRKRIDIVFNNRAAEGFFADLNSVHHIQCPYILVECKNYASDPRNPELDQLTGRFGEERGRFGILVCRRVADKGVMLQRCRDVLRDGRGYPIVLDDSDIKALLRLRSEQNTTAIDDYLDDVFRQVLF